MTTSANVIEYTIYKGVEKVGRFRKHLLCRLPAFSDLLKYQPLSEYSIQAWGYDEEDDEWEDDVVNLEEFLRERRLYDKVLNEYFTPPIKPCPCGGEPYLDRIAIMPPPYWVACNCGRRGKSSTNKDEAITNWNEDIIEE